MINCMFCNRVWNHNIQEYEYICDISIKRLCKDNSNCYYKQLKQLEKENERLKNKEI